MSEEFLGACRATRKAWFATNLLSRTNPQTVIEARRLLREGAEDELVSLLEELAGPAATPRLGDAFGLAAHRHLKLALIVGRLAVRAALVTRQGDDLDLDGVKTILVQWIDGGDTALEAAHHSVRDELRKLSDFAQTMTGTSDEAVQGRAGARMRLAVVAPLAAPVETLVVMQGLSPSIVDLMSSARSRVHVQAAESYADQVMRAHPDHQKQTSVA